MRTSPGVLRVVACIALALSSSPHALARPKIVCPHETALPGSGQSNDAYGGAVAIKGNVAVVGAAGFSSAAGAALVYRFDIFAGWVFEQQLTATDAEAGDGFGFAVALDDDIIVVGAYFDDDQGAHSGSAYVFKHDGSAWVQQQKLLADDGAAGDQFGNAVAIEGDTALIAACADDPPTGGVDAGSAYVFTFNGSTWSQQQKLLASDFAAQDFFGRSLAMSGSLVAVGADGDDDLGSRAGAAYIFRKSGPSWVQEEKLHAPDGQPFDFFGFAVAIHGETALMGSHGDDDNGNFSGSAHVFVRNAAATWNHQDKLMPSDGAALDRFGLTVSVSGNTALVGSCLSDEGAVDAGSAYAFRRAAGGGQAWSQADKLLSTKAASGQAFGFAVALHGDAALIGAWNPEGDGDPGSAYVFLNVLEDCNRTLAADFCDIASGSISFDANQDGIPDECQPAACEADIAPAGAHDGTVNVTDLLAVISAWGPCADCPADLDASGGVNVVDLLAVISAWGPCL